MIKINIKYVIAILLMLALAVSGVFSSISCVKHSKGDFMNGLRNLTINSAVYLRIEPGYKNDVMKIRACSDSKFMKYNPTAVQGTKRPDTLVVQYLRDDQFPCQITINASHPMAQVDVVDLDVEHLVINADAGVKVFYRPSRFIDIATFGDSVVYNFRPYIKTRE